MRLLATLAACLVVSGSAHASVVDSQKADQLFRTAIASAEAGQHEVAITNYRHLLREVPAPRIKLELARSLHLTGQYREALLLFREVYEADGTPQSVRRNIRPFLEEAELRILRVRYGMRVTTDTNPSKVADGGTIFFNGIPLEYQPPAPKEVSYGVEPWLSVEKLWNNGLLTKFHGSARLFENDDLRAGCFHFAVARQLKAVPGLFVQAAVDGEVMKDSAYVLPTFETWKRFRLSERAGIGIGGQVGYMMVENEDVSGGFYRPYVFGDWTFLPNATAFARASAEHLNSRNDYYSYVAPKIDLGINLRTAGFDLAPQLTATHTAFTQFDAFWGLKRKDTTVRPAVTFSHDRVEWNGFKPEFNLFYETRDSNVDIYDYDQMGGSLNVRRIF